MNHYVDRLTSYIQAHTRPTTLVSHEKKGDRPWNDPVPRVDENRARLPTLKAVVFDMTAVSHVDVTSVQIFVDVRKQLSTHASPDPVHFYFANIRSPWTRRALASAGFGYAAENVQLVFSVASGAAGPVVNERPQNTSSDEESQLGSTTPEKAGSDSSSPDVKVSGGRLLPIHSVDRPFFSTDVDEAMTSILLNLGVNIQTVANTPMPSPKIGATDALLPPGDKPVEAGDALPEPATERGVLEKRD